MKNLYTFLLAALSVFFLNEATAQGSYFGLKGGLTLGIQQWNSFEQDPLVKYHGIAFIESLEETGQFALFAQAGYHLKGSAIRNRNFISPINGNVFRPPAQQFIFRNASVTVGAKKKSWLGDAARWHYLIGLRGDYTISTNLDEYRQINEFSNSLFFPDDNFVRKVNYGLTLGGGIEYDLGEFVGAVLEFTLNPDLSFQYKQPSIPNVTDPYTGQSRTLSERSIRNVTLEVTLGIRFLRKVEYID